MSAYDRYAQVLKDKLDMALGQKEIINKAANIIKESVKKGGRFYVFGSGHSHMIAEEIYNRAGGFALVSAILEPSLMLHEKPNKSTYLERLYGYAEVLLKLNEVTDIDTIMIVSNSGRNPVPVEMAIRAKEIGCKVIAMTSLEHTRKVTSRHNSGKRLFEVADVVIDNCADFGDANFKIEGLNEPTGPTSDFTGIALAQLLIVQTLELLVKDGFKPPVFLSSNVDGADEHNDKLFKEYVNGSVKSSMKNY